MFCFISCQSSLHDISLNYIELLLRPIKILKIVKIYSITQLRPKKSIVVHQAVMKTQMSCMKHKMEEFYEYSLLQSQFCMLQTVVEYSKVSITLHCIRVVKSKFPLIDVQGLLLINSSLQFLGHIKSQNKKVCQNFLSIGTSILKALIQWPSHAFRYHVTDNFIPPSCTLA